MRVGAPLRVWEEHQREILRLQLDFTFALWVWPVVPDSRSLVEMWGVKRKLRLGEGEDSGELEVSWW